MDSKTLIKALKIAVREVIKEELTEILREGLQSTINEMSQPKKSVKTQTHRVPPRMVNEAGRKSKVQFTGNKWASVLNETDALVESGPMAMNSFKEMMQESVDEIHMTSNDARAFGMMRNNMKSSLGLEPIAPTIMEDPEDGKVYEVKPEIQQALTRDYSAIMKAIDAKKGM